VKRRPGPALDGAAPGPAAARLPRAVGARLGELCRRYDLAPGAEQALARLLALVAEDPTAPTAVRDPAAAVDVHVADSLAALELPVVRAAREIVDVGAGAGFPGLPLAIALAGAEVVLLESAARKCAWLARAIEAAGVVNARVVNARAEAWPEGIGGADLVTARAVAPLPVLLEYAAPLLARGGAFVAWKGTRDAVEEAAAARAAELLGLEVREVVRSRPWDAARDHHLYLYVKVGSTPNKYPRRPGMAMKRPLGAN